MSKRKGLSAEEKRERMLEIFHSTSDFFLLKELEKLGPKKGVIAQSVKDVIQSLVDDDLVLKDKIGTSVYFWSLPSASGQKLRQEEEALEAAVRGLEARKASLEGAIRGAQQGREEGEDREACLAILTQLEERHQQLKAEVAELSENDPEAFEAKKKARRTAVDAANRWTENIFALQQWCNDNCPSGPESLARLYHEVGITDDLDYVE